MCFLTTFMEQCCQDDVNNNQLLIPHRENDIQMLPLMPLLENIVLFLSSSLAVPVSDNLLAVDLLEKPLFS